MKIVYIHTDPFPSQKAGSVFSLGTAQGLARAGHEAVLVMPSAGRSPSKALSHYGTTLPNNMKIELPAPSSLRFGLFNITFGERYLHAVRNLLSNMRNDIDGIVVRSLKSAAFLSREKLPAPLIYEMHDWYADVDLKWNGTDDMIGPDKLRRERRLSRLEKKTIPRVSGVITLRQITAELVDQYYAPVPIRVIPTGLDVPGAFGPTPSEPLAVYAGQLHKHKGLDVFLDGAAAHPELRLLIVGDGDGLSALKETARVKKMEERVRFTGYVPRAQVPDFLSMARVGVLPLRDCFFNRYITSPLKILEYFSAGLPVVASDLPVVREMVEHEKTGLLVPPEDPDALADAVRRLCTDDDLHKKCRANIASKLEQLSWKTRGERIANFVSDLH